MAAALGQRESGITAMVRRLLAAGLVDRRVLPCSPMTMVLGFDAWEFH